MYSCKAISFYQHREFLSLARSSVPYFQKSFLPPHLDQEINAGNGGGGIYKLEDIEKGRHLKGETLRGNYIKRGKHLKGKTLRGKILRENIERSQGRDCWSIWDWSIRRSWIARCKGPLFGRISELIGIPCPAERGGFLRERGAIAAEFGSCGAGFGII